MHLSPDFFSSRFHYTLSSMQFLPFPIVGRRPLSTNYDCCSNKGSSSSPAAPAHCVVRFRSTAFKLPDKILNVRERPSIVGSRSTAATSISDIGQWCLQQAASMDASTADLSDHDGRIQLPTSNILGLQQGSLKAVIFDVDGTLCDSDPLHHIAFSESLQEVGFQGGEPISEGFFMEHMTGKDAWEVVRRLFPEWDEDRQNKFVEDKEARFQRLARDLLKPVEGLASVCNWIEERGLQRAAVTNAPRQNAELMISLLGLSDFFQAHLVVGSECERGKPFPDPYLKALHHFNLVPRQAFVFEDSPTGLQAAVSAGMPAIAVGTRNPEAALLRAGACFTVPDYTDPKLWNVLRAL